MEQQLYVDQLDVGMVLSRPVHCQRHLVFPAGTYLSPQQIYKLRRFNVEKVYVKAYRQEVA